jgi:hypothetical protein
VTRVGALLAAALLLVLGVASAAPAAAADPTPRPGIPLEVVVGGSSPVSGSTSTSAGGGYSSGGSSHASGSGADETAVPPADVALAEPVEPVDASSVIDVSGLRTRYHVSFDPGGGRLAVRFVVRNSSHRTIDATAKFWASAALGGHHVGTAPTVAVNAIAPGESRTVEQEISGVGQWTVVTAHMKLSPVVPGAETPIEPLSRDRTVLAIPWAVIVLVLVVAAGFVSARFSGDRGLPAATAEPVVVA